MPPVPDPSVPGRDEPHAGAPLVPLIPVVRNVSWTPKRVGFIVLAVVLILLGLLTVPVPFASGIVFWIPGLLLLGIALPPVARCFNRQERRLPDRWRRRLRPRLWLRLRRRLQRAAR